MIKSNFTDHEVLSLYNFYITETSRLRSIRVRTKSSRIKMKLFDLIGKLKDKYDWTYDEVYRRKLI
jgi:hypothetical protein